MGYRGRKFIEQIRSLEKRNLIQEESYSDIHNRGRGEKYRSWYPDCTYTPPQIAALSEAIRSGEKNFMDGISYRINPVDTLTMCWYRNTDIAQPSFTDGQEPHME